MTWIPPWHRNWLRRAMRVLAATVFTQAARQAPEAAEPLACSAKSMSSWIQNAPSGCDTFRGVVSRDTLAKGALEDIVEVFHVVCVSTL